MKFQKGLYLATIAIVLMVFTLACNKQNEHNEDSKNMKIMDDTVEVTPNSPVSESTLKMLLDEKKANFNAKASEEKKTAYARGIEEIRQSGLLDSALKTGDKAPNFSLTNQNGKPIELYQKLKSGPVILTWYRGGWCPYCNLTLHALQQYMPKYKEQKASLLALTPELPDSSLSTVEKHEIEYEVLSDVGNKVAKKYNVVFQLNDQIADMYQNSFDLHGYNGDESNELPLAATYIVDQKGIIRYTFLDADYRNRAEPELILQALKNLNK